MGKVVAGTNLGITKVLQRNLPEETEDKNKNFISG
jgi:hypothetical protein